MKKSVVYSSIVAAGLVAASAGTFIISNAEANGVAPESAVSLAGTEALATTDAQKILNSKDETVYVITDATGTVKTKYIGNSLYTGDAELPYEMNVKYYLDGAEISAAELAGKSGHIKIVYDYTSTAWYNGVKVPFLAVTGMGFDGAKFSNLKLTNGKVVSEGETYAVVGYALLGANETLGTDILPSGFTVEADVKDFELGTAYTVIMNDIFADVDTTRLSDVDGLVSSVNQLAAGLDEITGGASRLGDGLATAVAGVKKLNAGAGELAEGINGAAAGAGKISGGLGTITANNEALQGGADAIIAATLAKVNAATEALGVTVTAENYEATLPQVIAAVGPKSEAGTALTEAYKTLTFAVGVKAYTAGVAQVSTGVGELAAGLEYMNGKMSEFTAGLSELESGLAELNDGAEKLNGGLATFKSSGVDKLVNFANKDLAGFTRNARRLVTAAANYKSYGDRNAETVKFVVKTAGVK